MSLWFGRRRGERILEKQLRNGVFGLALAGLLAFSPYFPIAQTSGKSEGSARAAVRVWQDTIELPTYEEGLPDANPPFDQFVTNGRYNYPYTMRENLTNHVAPRRWRTLNLENEYLKWVILPD